MAPSWGTLTAPVQGRSPVVVRSVRTMQLLVIATVLAFVVSTLGVRERPGFDVWLDGWLKCSAYVLCAVLLAMRPLLSDVDRRLWALVAAGVASRAAAFVVYIAVIRRSDPEPYPSVADIGWLLMYAFFAAALLGLARSRFRAVTVPLTLDAVVALCGATAVSLAVVPDVLRTLNDTASDAAIVFNTLYPLLDVGLFLVTLGVLLLYGWRPPPAVWLFAAGTLLFAVVDVAYLVMLAEGAFRPGTPVQGLALAANALLAFSGWVAPGRPRVDRDVVPGLAVPALLSLSCVGLLVTAASRPGSVPHAALALAVVGVTAAVVRTATSFASLRRAAATERRAARQGLMERLVEAQDAERARIAADVHDDSIQALAAVDMRLSALQRRLRTSAPEELPGVETVIQSVHEATGRLRSLLFELETPAVEADLADAIRDAAAHVFEDTSTQVRVIEVARAPLPTSLRVSAYRIAREALVNVRKHAHARTVTVTVDAHAHGVAVQVVDDGLVLSVPGAAALVRELLLGQR